MTSGPALFNACDYLLDRHIREGRGDKLALTGVAGDMSYAELAGRYSGKSRRHESGRLQSRGFQSGGQNTIWFTSCHALSALERYLF